ncbi:hypothetical protein ITI46_34255 [Streptomyces oryzae]|uniref:Uncharacterized protein n=1 Tax=Streptomyces oryzae TaxID=1434886 RepID=A0ABS3XMM6_9ACTN|nr:hypothetical protein [Streptomyces oryzae]MBO8196655.1 hypothetical protein [Streptomyces oryzae]
MSDIEKASRETVEAARQGEQFALMLAAVQATAQQTQPAPCRHHQQAPARPFDARKAVTTPPAAAPPPRACPCSSWRSPSVQWV